MPDESGLGEETNDLRLLSALGTLLLYANDFEEALADLYWVVSGKDSKIVLKEVRELTLGRLARLFVSTYLRSVPDAALLLRMNSLQPRITAAVKKRNEFVHASWAWEWGSDLVQRNRRPRGGEAREEIVKMHPDHIMAAAIEIGDVAEAIFDLWDETVASVGGLPPGAVVQVHAEDWTKNKP